MQAPGASDSAVEISTETRRVQFMSPTPREVEDRMPHRLLESCYTINHFGALKDETDSTDDHDAQNPSESSSVETFLDGELSL